MKTICKRLGLLIFVLVNIVILSSHKLPHCEIPCGIYGDSIRIALLKEHVKTVEKSIQEIKKIEKMEQPNFNQLVRWINNKEKHCNEIQHISTQYFMFQRVKIIGEKDKKNNQLLVMLHKICVISMKLKQNPNIILINQIRESIIKFEKLYFSK